MEKKLQIELKDVTLAYGSRSVLQHFDLQIGAHEFVGLVGPNGCGKTSVLKAILGLLPPREGAIHYYRDHKLVSRLRMGYLPQYSQLDRKFPISVYEIVLSGLNSEKKLYRKFTDSQHAMVRRTIHDMGIEGMEDRQVGALSGGELQRALLGRALVSNPEVLVLDEPSTYMDRRFGEKLYTLLERIRQERTILLVSHNLDEVRRQADRIVTL